MELLYFVLCAYGMTQILVYGNIFSYLREKVEEKSEWLGELVNCPMCTGFWIGLFLAGINEYTELFTFDINIVTYFLLGCLSSGTSYILCTLFGDNGVKHEHRSLDS